jgi:hypothetical protein
MRAESKHEGRVLTRFQCGQGNLCLKLRLPENWTSSKGDDVAGAGLGAGVRVIGVTTMESSKVSQHQHNNQERDPQLELQ